MCDENKNVSVPRGDGAHCPPPLFTSLPRPGGWGHFGDSKGLGEGQGISCLDAGRMSEHLCPYSGPPVKHSRRKFLTKQDGAELVEAKRCLENSWSLHTVSPSLHHFFSRQTGWKPVSSSTGHAGRTPWSPLVPACSSPRDTAMSSYSLFPSLLSSFCLFSLPLYSTKPSVIIPAGARHLSYCCLYAAGSKLSFWE